jgi:hypothetical protein
VGRQPQSTKVITVREDQGFIWQSRRVGQVLRASGIYIAVSALGALATPDPKDLEQLSTAMFFSMRPLTN